MAQYRYSVSEFRQAVLVAAAITAMFTGLVWMLTAAAHSDALFWASISGLVFFALISAPTLLRFLRNEVVLAVRPTGLYDARQGTATVAWDDIRDIIALRRENAYELQVYLWHTQQRGRSEVNADLVIGLDDLDADPRRIIADISAYKPVAAGPGVPQADISAIPGR